MIKFLFVLFIIGFLCYLGLLFLKHNFIRFMKQFTPPTQEQPKTKELSGEKLVACEHCKMYIPTSKAIQKNGVSYCEEHAP
jgi:hypothetical protein